MDDISNRTLALFLVTAIIVSLASTIWTLNVVDDAKSQGRFPTALASSDQGNVTLEVTQDLSIVLNVDTIDFGTGRVNGSCLADTNNATLTAGASYNDTGNNDCWTNNTLQPLGFLLENNGNVNVSINVTGPQEQDFFGNYPGSNPYNITWQSRANESGSCPSALLQAGFTSFNGTTKRVCGSLKFDPESQDEVGVDIKVVIPTDIPTGTYENSTIEFLATAV